MRRFPVSSDMEKAEPEAPLTYRSTGVDIDAGNEAVRRIKSMVAQTRQPGQIDELGGFAGMMALPTGMAEPVLVSCTDGVGTKLLVAIATGRHSTVGIDLVAMSVNDLLCTGGKPLFVLDYIATGRVEPGHVEAIVSGIANGCRQSGCALLGGETAELPGMYADGHYDLAAFAVGVVDKAKAWAPSRVLAGDVVLALPSSGLHSNGYSLARKALLGPQYAGLGYDDPLPGGSTTVADALLEPTRIYESGFAELRRLEGAAVRAAAHITGGGLLENPPRAFGDHLCVDLDLGDLPLPAVFQAIADQGVAPQEMARTFNLGAGMLLYVDPNRVGEVSEALERAHEPVFEVGRVRARDVAGNEPTVHLRGR